MLFVIYVNIKITNEYVNGEGAKSHLLMTPIPVDSCEAVVTLIAFALQKIPLHPPPHHPVRTASTCVVKNTLVDQHRRIKPPFSALPSAKKLTFSVLK